MTERRITRVAVTGSESTGKTTLARDLAAHFGAPWVAEQARAYAARVKRALTAEDVAPIASEQIAAEDAAFAEATRGKGGWLFLDTDLVSTVVYARHYYGSCPAWIEAEARARLADLYLLSDIDVPWSTDAVRDRPNSREELHAAFQAVMSEFKARKCLVRGLGRHRLEAALNCIASEDRLAM
jgi:NadR type nicotinamide-nucleotide adenylyltransferase